MLPVIDRRSDEKQRMAEKAQSSTMLPETMTPFALSRLMPLPFWPVPPDRARYAGNAVAADDRAVLALRVAGDENAGVAAILHDIVADRHAVPHGAVDADFSVARGMAVLDAAGGAVDLYAGAAAVQERAVVDHAIRDSSASSKAEASISMRSPSRVSPSSRSRAGVLGRKHAVPAAEGKHGLPGDADQVRVGGEGDIADAVAAGRQEERSFLGLRFFEGEGEEGALVVGRAGGKAFVGGVDRAAQEAFCRRAAREHVLRQHGQQRRAEQRTSRNRVRISLPKNLHVSIEPHSRRRRRAGGCSGLREYHRRAWISRTLRAGGAGVSARAMRKIFHLVLVKPTHYDDEGYPLQWRRSIIPSNALACVHGLAEDCSRAQSPGRRRRDQNSRDRRDELARAARTS